MSNLVNFLFEDHTVRYLGDGVTHCWVAQDVCNVLGIKNASDALKEFSQNQKGIATIYTRSENNVEQAREVLTVTESGLYRLLFKSRKPIAERFQNWVADEVLPSIRKTGSYFVEGERERLERQFRPQPTAKDRADALRILKIGGHCKEYIQRLSLQMARKIDPSIDPPVAEEMVSLPATEALLTPTKIAEELKMFCKTNPTKGDARRVNKLLEKLGYQEKVAGMWSATGKAASANLCDRKPVETGSRTQKDQLLWATSVLDILREHQDLAV